MISCFAGGYIFGKILYILRFHCRCGSGAGLGGVFCPYRFRYSLSINVSRAGVCQNVGLW
ncbi:MAG: hypothetical protein LBJ00_05070 [Planctomycetaceae bacterium]|nr:hypothetical protein [Planctomycetaceae bacterium]